VPIEEAEQALPAQVAEVQGIAEPAPDDGFDFEAQGRPVEEQDLIGKALTDEVVQQEAAEVAEAPEDEPKEVIGSNGNPFEVTEGNERTQHVQSWGLRVVATIPQAQPPRAILELPAGGEVVVVPGTLLPETGVVVLAIRDRLVKIAEVTPQGAHAEVTSRELHAMY